MVSILVKFDEINPCTDFNNIQMNGRHDLQTTCKNLDNEMPFIPRSEQWYGIKDTEICSQLLQVI